MRVRFWLALITAGAFALPSSAASALGCDTTAWRGAVEQYAGKHPLAEAADLYKLVHQGIMGSEHAVSDTAAASAWMRRELATLSTPASKDTRAALIEKLPPDGRFVRVNLRPFIAAGGDPSQLVRAFVATANQSKGDTAQFACVERALTRGDARQAFSRLASLIHERRKTGFDAAHHSAAFEATYSPAYRVVRATLADSLFVRSGRRPPERSGP